MEFQTITSTCYYFYGSVNIGYVKKGEQGLLIDSGIDQSTMKKVLKQLKLHELPLTHLFITHAHTDHFGGAAYLQEKSPVYTIAPLLEEAIMRNPILEPLYLFGGNDPLPELRNKFLEGPPMRVDHVVEEGHYTIGNFGFETIHVPGHSYYQLAIKVDEILYAGDAYFSEEQLLKHKIPFLTDAQLALHSLDKIKKIDCIGTVPGHGVFEHDFQETVDKNIAYHNSLLHWLETQIRKNRDGITHESIISQMCVHFGVQAKQLSQWLLFRTAVTSYLIALVKRERIDYRIKEAKWLFYAKEEA